MGKLSLETLGIVTGPQFLFLLISQTAFFSYAGKQVILNMEPPHIVKNAIMGTYDAVLATYLRASDIPVSYGKWRSNNDTENMMQKFSNSYELNYLYNKTKLAAAIISNCSSKLRLSFINALRSHQVHVDVYGRCGSLKCSKTQKYTCLSEIGSKYKFFFAFENSNCMDYITEKYFQNALMSGMVPVVMGAPKESYDALGPPDAYIHVSDFESPKELAEYLLYLDSHDDEYRKYFAWKAKGYITNDTLLDVFCRVCGMLFYRDFVKNPSWNNPTIEFKDINPCLPPNKWIWE